jgi:5-methylcytosine-specific restriction endonuclease McrA
VNDVVDGVPSANGVREHGEFGVSTLYRHFGSFENARREAGIDGEVTTGVSDEELLADLRRVDDSLEKTVAAADYDELGNHSPSTLRERFGGMDEARDAAGIDGDPNSRNRISDEELLSDVESVYERLGEPPSENQYKQHGEYSLGTIRRRFPTYTQAREEAGIPNPDKRTAYGRVSDEELIDAIDDLVSKYGRPPTRQEMLEEGRHTTKTYYERFGNWNSALRAAGYDPPHERNKERETYACSNCGETVERLPSDVEDDQENVYCSRECKHEHQSDLYEASSNPNWQGGKETVVCATCGDELSRKPAEVRQKEQFFCDYDCYGDWRSEHVTGDRHARWKGGGEFYYGPNWHTQRRKRLEVDDHECQRCGMTEEESRRTSGRGIEVHHLVSVREFYERSGGNAPDWSALNDLDNLLTLCRSCHRAWEGIPLSPHRVDES